MKILEISFFKQRAVPFGSLRKLEVVCALIDALCRD